MAPIDPHFHDSYLLGSAALSTYALAVTTSIALIARTLKRAYSDAPIAQRTRSHAPERRHEFTISAGLAVVSFAMNVYHTIDAGVASYTGWRVLSEQAMPINIWTASTWFPQFNKPNEVQIGRWLKETDWLQEVSFALAGRSRDYWWAQQLSAATMIWCIFVAIEGRRRNIPHTWAFVLLAHLVGLSTSQNLFSIALLLTPLPIVRRRSRGTNRPTTWTPHAALHIIPFFTAMICTALFPYMSSNPALFTLSAIPAAMTFVPLFVTTSKLIPTTWGTTHTTIHAAHASSLPTFATASRLALTLHMITSAASIFLSIPSPNATNRAHYDHIWSTHQPLTTSTRFRIACSRLLGSISDNPLVRKVGWDVILSGLSISAWAATRGLDASHILEAGGVPGVKAALKETAITASATAQDLGASTAKAAASAAKTASALAKEVAASAQGLASSAVSTLGLDDNVATTTTLAKDAAASAKDLASSAVSALGLDDTAATTTVRPAASPTKRKAGRPRGNSTKARQQKAQPAPKQDPLSSSSDKDYHPTTRPAAPHEHEEEHGRVDAVDGAESAALAWGMLVVGGLGSAGAGVWGAESVTR